MIDKLLKEHHLECLSSKGGCRGSSESTHVKMPHCRKSHALAQFQFYTDVVKIASVKVIPIAFVYTSIKITVTPLYLYHACIQKHLGNHVYISIAEQCLYTLASWISLIHKYSLTMLVYRSIGEVTYTQVELFHA